MRTGYVVRLLAAWSCLAVSVGAMGCDGDTRKGAAPAASSVLPVSATAATPPAPTPNVVPHLTVDAEGPSIGGKRWPTASASERAAFARAVKELPVQAKDITVVADKKARTVDVTSLVGALGEAGVASVVLRTDGRNDLPKEVHLSPEERLSSPAGCTLVALAQKDLSTALWTVQGGGSRLVGKGLGGPDLTRVGDDARVRLGGCASTAALVAGDPSLGWETTFNLLGTVVATDAALPKKKLSALVLLKSVPTPGRPVALGSAGH